MTAAKSDEIGQNGQQARRMPMVFVAGTDDSIDFFRRAIDLIGKEWQVEGAPVEAGRLARLAESRTDALLIPLEYLTGSPDVAEAAQWADAPILPYRTSPRGSEGTPASGGRYGESILCLATASPSHLVSAIEEEMERFAHTRALRERSGGDEEMDAQIEFLSAVNHEVRTPLNAILGMAESLAEANLPTEYAEQARIIRSSGRDLLYVLEQLVDLARLRSGEVRRRSVETDLEAVLHEVAESQSMSIHRKGLGLSVVVARSLPSLVLGDRVRLAQVLRILVRNALRMTREGEIKISARPDPAWADSNVVEFAIDHTGEAIGEDTLSLLGNSSVAVSREYGGFGIGLALADGLVKAMGGELTSNENGRSIRFSLIFQPLALRRAEATGAAQLHGVRLLIASPHAVELGAIVAALESAGALVSKAIDPEQAIEAITAAGQTDKPYELVLVDASFCTQTFASELRRLVENPPELVAISHAGPDSRFMEDLARVGVRLRLATPAPPDEIRGAIEAIYAGNPPLDCVVAPETTAGRRLLLVDDSAENRRLVMMYLKNSGYEIDEACDGQEAVEAASSADYSIILMDVQMPGMNGYEATTEIRRLERESDATPVPIVALTAFSMDEDADRSIEVGCDVHLSKPVRKDALLDTIKRLASRSSQTKAEPGQPDEIEAEIAALRPAYLEQRLAEAARIRLATAKEAWDEAVVAGHRMAGSAVGYGFPALEELGREIESAARAHDGAALETLAVALEEVVRSAMERLKADD